MNTDQIIDLLALSAAYDQRTVGDLDVRAWALAAETEHWDPPVVQRVIVEHYARGADRPRITPAAISDRVRELRRRAALSFEAPRIPDPAPQDYPGWLRAQIARHVDTLLADWAHRGGDMPESAPAVAARIGTVNQLSNAAPPQLRTGIRSASAKLMARRP